MNITKLDEFLMQNKFKEAIDLFKTELLNRNLINPALDKEWAIYADKIAFITAKKGIQDTISFWEDLFNFFKDDIEKSLNNKVHKGHILFRWGLALLLSDFEKAKMKLKEALEEDRALAKAQTSNPEEAQQRLKQFSAYAMLCILESLKFISFSNDTERKQFFEGILSKAYDFAIFQSTKDPEAVKKILSTKISQKEIAKHAVDVYNELWSALINECTITIVTLCGVMLECMLLSKLLSQNVTQLTIKKKDIKDAELGELLAEAEHQGILSNNNIRAIGSLIHAFRNRIHPANELQKQDYPLAPQVAKTLKNLTDYAIETWN